MIGKTWIVLAMASAAAASAPAAAQGDGSLTSKIELEKSTPTTAEGRPEQKIYVAPDVVVPGDRVRVTLTFTNKGAAPASGVNLVNPIPEGLTYDDTADAAGFGVSTDGKIFGELASLTVPVEGSGSRPATAADVTHVRWQWPDAIAPGQSRSVAFFGRVR